MNAQLRSDAEQIARSAQLHVLLRNLKTVIGVLHNRKALLRRLAFLAIHENLADHTLMRCHGYISGIQHKI